MMRSSWDGLSSENALVGDSDLSFLHLLLVKTCMLKGNADMPTGQKYFSFKTIVLENSNSSVTRKAHTT